MSRKLTAAATVILGVFAIYLISLNFHEIAPGQAYRSAQLNKTELGVILPYFKIKTIVNLRGPNGAQWYKDEMQEAERNHVRLISLDMSSREIPDKDTLRQLIEAFHTAEKPMLIHDLSGADRAGEASALYELVVLRKPKNEALDMLSWRYHHFDFFRPAKRYFIELFQSEEWALNDYDPCSGKYQYYDTKNPKCHPSAAKPSCTSSPGDPLSETPQCQ